jgi:hypothetical protein
MNVKLNLMKYYEWAKFIIDYSNKNTLRVKGKMDMDFAPLDTNNDTASKSKKTVFKKNVTPITLKMLPQIVVSDNKKMLDNF